MPTELGTSKEYLDGFACPVAHDVRAVDGLGWAAEPRMRTYVLKRIFYSIFVLWGAITIVFIVVRVLPADPALLILGPDATVAQVEALREQLGLNVPLVAQYFQYLGDILRFDFGDSYRLKVPAMELVLQRAPATLALATVALVISLVTGLVFGLIAALRVNKFADRVISAVSIAAQALPQFWIGLVLVLIFAKWLKLLPSAGDSTPAHFILPALTLSLAFTALLTRLTRSGLLEVVNEGYIQTARAKGLRERTVIVSHAVRNALIPIVTVVGLQFGQLLGGTVIVETVFAWPGVGRLLVQSIENRDYDVIQAAVIFLAVGFVTINLVVDIAYGVIDPRIRLGARR